MEKFQYPMTDRANIANDGASDTQSRTSKGSYLKRSNNNTGSQSYHRILSRSRKKNNDSKEFDSTYIKINKSFTVQPQNIRRIVRTMLKLVQGRQRDSLNILALNLEQSTSFSFDGNGIHWSRIQDELGIEEKEKANLLSKKINLEENLNHNRTDNISIKTPKIPKLKEKKAHRSKKVRVLEDIQNMEPQIELKTPKSVNSIKQQLNLIKKTLKNTKKLIELETKQTNKKRSHQLTDRVYTQHNNNVYQSNLSTSRNKTTRNNCSYNFSNTPRTYTPHGGSTSRSYVQSFWNDQIIQNKSSKSRLAQRNEQVVVHHVIQPVIHHVYHPTIYQTSSFQIVNQSRLQPVLIPRRGSINQALGKYVSQIPTSYYLPGSVSSHNIHQRPIGSFFPQSPQYQKPQYY